MRAGDHPALYPMLLIPAGLLAIIFLVATIIKFVKHEYEHALTRMLLMTFYGLLALMPSIEMSTARMLARYFILLLGVIEILSWLVITILRMRKGRR